MPHNVLFKGYSQPRISKASLKVAVESSKEWDVLITLIVLVLLRLKPRVDLECNFIFLECCVFKNSLPLCPSFVLGWLPSLGFCIILRKWNFRQQNNQASFYSKRSPALKSHPDQNQFLTIFPMWLRKGRGMSYKVNQIFSWRLFSTKSYSWS